MIDLNDAKFMPIDVFEGGNGDLVLCQEWGSIEREQYMRVMLVMKDAEKLAMEILAVARAARRKANGDS